MDSTHRFAHDMPICAADLPKMTVLAQPRQRRGDDQWQLQIDRSLDEFPERI